MLPSPDLEVVMMQDPVASLCFVGVFASNELPSKIPTFPSSLAPNTDPITNLVSTWWPCISPNKRRRNSLTVTDFPRITTRPGLKKFLPSYPGDTERNVGTLQDLNSNVCGYYYVWLLLFFSPRSPSGS